MSRRPYAPRRRRVWTVLPVAALLVAAAGCGQGDPSPGAAAETTAATTSATARLASAEDGDLRLSRGWATRSQQRPGMGGATSAAYALLENTGDRDDRLVAASSPAAAQVQVHETVDTGGSAGTMREVDQLTVPAAGRAALSPGGSHLMLMGLEDDLQVGSTVTIDLEFASGTRLSVRFPVISRADRPTIPSGSGM